MKIRYLGHSCFVLTDSTGMRIVTDPYGDVGFAMPKTCAEAVSVSHSHYDHCNVRAVGGNPVIFEREGEYRIGNVRVSAVKSFHDEVQGRKRGENLIFKFVIDGITVCHLGDLGEECSPALVKAIAPADVLLIPVGGTYTVDAVQAKKYVDAVKPRVVIPMHYKMPGLDLNIDGADGFVNAFPRECVSKVDGSEIQLSRGELCGDTTKILLLERAI